MKRLLLALLAPRRDYIDPAHLAQLVARADMDQHPTPPAGVRAVKLTREARERLERSHYWRQA